MGGFSLLGGLIGLIFLFMLGAAAVFIGGVVGVAGVKFGTKIFGPIEIRLKSDAADTFD